ncbi:MAG: TM0106 family RecB-like putative nuclease, partial [Tepidisphaeraceae bacterium]
MIARTAPFAKTVFADRCTSRAMEASMPLTGKLFTSFISCKYKAHLHAMGETGDISAHERLLTDLDQNYLKESLNLYRDQLGSGQVRDNPESIVAAISEGRGLITNSLATTGRLSVVFEALERVPSDTKVGASTQQYVPLVFGHREKVTGHDKLLATFYAVALAEIIGTLPTHAKIIHGHDRTATKVALVKPTGITEIGIKVRRLMDELATQIGGSSPPQLTLNNHCAQCEFRHRCHDTAVEKDDISLLRGLSMGEVEQWRKRGVFTVTQLAYTFRAKSVTGKGAKTGRHLPPLQALAVRDKKIYLVHQPDLSEARVRVFLDVEGVPDRDFYYLVGVAVEEGGQTRTHSFWADGREAESRIWFDLITLLLGLGNFTAYHYGRYDRTFLDHMISRYGVPHGSELLVERLKAETVDVLANISGNIYFPVYSRSLKAVGAFVGAIWSDKSASGVQSLVWRHQWEETGDAALRQSLIQYNLEDCFALRLVIDFLRNLSRGSTGALEVVRSDELRTSTIHRFGMGRAATPEIGNIIKCAYFDYQISKVFFRTNPAVRKILRRKKIRWRSPKVNKVIECCAPKTCPHCRSEKVYVYQNSAVKKLVYDLRFTASGVRRWVVRYETKRYGCNSCAATTYSPDYPTHGSHLGDGLCSWVIHAHVGLKQSFADISSGVNDSFGYSFADRLAYRIKLQAAKEYAPMLERLLAKLRASHVLYIDETKVLNGEKRGYVWAVTNLEEVVYLFRARGKNPWTLVNLWRSDKEVWMTLESLARRLP